MPDTIVVALIALVGTILSVVASARATQDKVSQELHTQTELQELKIAQLSSEVKEMKVDIKSHNNYARMFSEILPVVQEKQSVANHRLDDLEADLKEIKRDLNAQ